MLNFYLLLLYTGKIKRLIVTMPPQHGKSELITKALVCWWLGWRPDDQIAIVSYAAGVAEKFGAHCRDQFAKWGAQLFGVTVDPKHRNRKEWGVKGRKGVVRAVGVGGQLTSHRVDLGIIDDPIKGRKQSSKAEHREAQKLWFRDEFLSRLSKDAKWIIVQTRWHTDDLAGYAETNFAEGVVVVHLPAIAVDPSEIPEEEHAKYLPDPLGRKPGEALCPELHPIEQLEEQRALDDDGPNFWSIYQGIPKPGKGGIYDPKYWREFGGGQFLLRWDPGRECYYYFSAIKYDEVFISGDCTYGDTARADKVALGVFARKGTQLLLLRVIARRMSLDDTVDALKTLKSEFPMIGPVLIEEKASGPEVVARLRGVVGGLMLRNPQGTSKVERAEATRYLFVAGDLLLPPLGQRGWIYLDTSWVRGYKAELQQFPFGPDDQVDITTQAFKYLQERTGTTKAVFKTRPNTLKQKMQRTNPSQRRRSS